MKNIKKQFLKNFIFLKKKKDEIANIETDKSERKGPEMRKIGSRIKK